MEYQIMFYGGMAGALIALILAIFLYIKLNIPQVVKDLTGIRLPAIGKFASRQQYADSEQTGRITNEIKLRKHVDVSKAERTLTMKNEQTKQTATHPLGGDISVASLSGAISTGPTKKAAKRPGAGGTTLLEEVGQPPRPAAEDTVLLQNGQPAAEMETTLLGDAQNARPGVGETTLLGETQNSQPGAAETTLLGEAQNARPRVGETTLLGEAQNARPGVGETTLLDDAQNAQPGAAETTLLGEAQNAQPGAAETTLLGEAQNAQPGAAETTLLGDAQNVQPGVMETTLLGDALNAQPGAAETTLLGETLNGQPGAMETALLGASLSERQDEEERQLVKAGAQIGREGSAYPSSANRSGWEPLASLSGYNVGPPAGNPGQKDNGELQGDGQDGLHPGSKADAPKIGAHHEQDPLHQGQGIFREETSLFEAGDPAETTLLGIEEPEEEPHFKKEVDIMIVHTKMTI